MRSPTPRGVRKEAMRLVREIVDGAFPARSRIEQTEGMCAVYTGRESMSRYPDSSARTQRSDNRLKRKRTEQH